MSCKRTGAESASEWAAFVMFCSEVRTETMAELAGNEFSYPKLAMELEQKWIRLSQEQKVKFYWKAFKDMDQSDRKEFNAQHVLRRCGV